MASNKTIWMCQSGGTTEQVSYDQLEIARRHIAGWRQCKAPENAPEPQPETPAPAPEPEPVVTEEHRNVDGAQTN